MVFLRVYEQSVVCLCLVVGFVGFFFLFREKRGEVYQVNISHLYLLEI